MAAAADAALAAEPWQLPSASVPAPLFGGCFVAFARGEAGPGHAGDRAWAAAVTWRPPGQRARDGQGIEEEVVITGLTGAAYLPGLLALREGPLLDAAIGSLAKRPELLVVDASGRDHLRRAGMAVHLGARYGVPTVGVTHRPLLAEGALRVLRRGAITPLVVVGQQVGSWVCTATRSSGGGARRVAHGRGYCSRGRPGRLDRRSPGPGPSAGGPPHRQRGQGSGGGAHSARLTAEIAPISR